MKNIDHSGYQRGGSRVGDILTASTGPKHATRQEDQSDQISTLCMMRILRWELVSPINCNRVIDASYFYSALDNLQIDVAIEEVHAALDSLVERGFITFTFPYIANDLEGFIVRLAQRQDVKENNVEPLDY